MLLHSHTAPDCPFIERRLAEQALTPLFHGLLSNVAVEPVLEQRAEVEELRCVLAVSAKHRVAQRLAAQRACGMDRLAAHNLEVVCVAHRRRLSKGVILDGRPVVVQLR